ncbi:fimbrial protein [Salmonella enterica]|nr:fimbrial protein [Salmonella enterica]EGM2345279.1 fimbrial protein [Salmonella enterica]EGM2363797.1 fimbrial protein [Salmonella enterica]
MLKIIFGIIMILLPVYKTFSVDIPIKITGTIIIPPCEINNGKSIDVDFGNVMINNIESGRYNKKITFPVKCSYHQGDAHISIFGNNIESNNQIIATNIDGLGIILHQGSKGEILTVNSEAVISSGLKNKHSELSEIQLTAELYKDPGVNIETGVFNTSITIRIRYI